jgi:hypothetical protein
MKGLGIRHDFIVVSKQDIRRGQTCLMSLLGDLLLQAARRPMLHRQPICSDGVVHMLEGPSSRCRSKVELRQRDGFGTLIGYQLNL